MNGNEVLRIVDAIHRDKNIDKEIVFEGIEQAIVSAARKHFGEEQDLIVDIDRDNGEPTLTCDGEQIDSDVLGDILGRISAQTAKQVMIQKIREAERDALYDEYLAMQGQIVNGTITRIDRGAATVNLGKVEAILPHGEQIPGESHRAGERVRAIVLEVRKAGSRVKIILSRTHTELIRRLFEIEIPEVAEHIIEVRSLAREAGYRSKVAVSCIDNKIDSVGACVGVRGARIKSIVDELAGERIDIVRWNDSLQVLVPNALQPAEVEDVILCPMLGKVIVLVREDQLSLAIGKKGQNVRLASKLVGWDINVMTQENLDEQLDISVERFSTVPNVTEELAENLVAQGFFTFDDLSVIEPDQLAELSGLSPEECDVITEYADEQSLLIEQEEIRAAKQKALKEQQSALAPQPTAQPEPEPEPESEPKSESESESEPESETAVTPNEPESEPKPKPESESESETAPATAEQNAPEPEPATDRNQVASDQVASEKPADSVAEDSVAADSVAEDSVAEEKTGTGQEAEIAETESSTSTGDGEDQSVKNTETAASNE